MIGFIVDRAIKISVLLGTNLRKLATYVITVRSLSEMHQILI